MHIAVALFISWAACQAPTAPPDFAKLIERLSTDDVEGRERAAAELRSAGDAAIPALEAAAATNDAQLRVMVRRLLHDLSATSALIEDLKGDDIQDNARSARAKLRRRYGPQVRSALVQALKSDDDQQAVQAAFLLSVLKDGPLALSEAPGIVSRIARVIAEGRDHKFRWVAVEAVLSLGQYLSAEDREKAWSKGLADADPATLQDAFLGLYQVATRSKRPVPSALVRHYLKNLMNDTVDGNARDCRHFLRLLGAGLAPELRVVLSGYDAQARAMAIDLLLEWKQQDLPGETLVEGMAWSTRARDEVRSLGKSALAFLRPALLHSDPTVVIEAARMTHELEPGAHDAELAVPLAMLLSRKGSYWSHGAHARDLLGRLSDSADASLREGMTGADPLIALACARGLWSRDPKRHGEAIFARIEKEFASDARRENARRAAQLTFEMGEGALRRLKSLVETGRDQTLICAAAILARRGQLEPLSHEAVETVLKYAERPEMDEPGALLELLTWSEPLRAQVMRRLGPKARDWRVRLLGYEDEPWLTGGR